MVVVALLPLAICGGGGGAASSDMIGINSVHFFKEWFMSKLN